MKNSANRCLAKSRLLIAAACVPGLSAFAGLSVPAYTSRPAAPYTLYLDFGGFTFNGNWVTSGKTPGTTPAYDSDGNTAAFSATELSAIKEVWSRVAEKYSALSINVTTVDPAVAAGQAATDTARQNYYDNTAKTMHTIIGGTGSWYGNAGGVSYLGIAQSAQSGSGGYHTNWVFPGGAATNRRFLSEASAHELGHALKLNHQSDYTGTTLTAEYSSNGTATNGSYIGDGSYAPTMGNSYYTQRGLWRNGNAHGSGKISQNDFTTLGSNAGMTLVDDGNGHSTLTATDLPVTGLVVNAGLAKGIITPITLSSPNPIGAANYTKDYFRFFAVGSSVTLTCNDGSENITTGVADPGATLDSKLKIYNGAGALVATSTSSSNTLAETFSGTLPGGVYYAEVSSIGGYASTFDVTATYFTAGSFFLSGSNIYTRFNLAGANFTGAYLLGQNLSAANFASANLTSANLTSATLTSATLVSANLASATLTLANLASADLSLADLRGSTGYSPAGSTVTRGTILPAGTINGFTFNASETLRVRANAIAATSVDTISGPDIGTAGIQVDAGGVLNLAATASAGSNVRTLNGVGLSLQGAGPAASQTAVVRATTVTLVNGARTAAPNVAVLSSLSVASNGDALGSRSYYGLFDVGTNDAIVRNGSFADLNDMARSGQNGLTLFGGNGITSSAAAADASGLARYAVAVVQNNIGGTPLFDTFDGVSVGLSDVLIKFTYFGDADLSGAVDDTDFFLTNTGYTTSLTGWLYGDFDYSGIVDDTDFYLLNNAYSQQGPGLRAAGGGSVPEPGTLAAGLVGLVICCRQRRRV